jgi:hypothetical protein
MNSELKKTLDSFTINGCRSLNSTGIDGVHVILPMIHGLAELLQMGFRKGENGEALFDNANPELVAAAFDGIGFLAATALLHADNL